MAMAGNRGLGAGYRWGSLEGGVVVRVRAVDAEVDCTGEGLLHGWIFVSRGAAGGPCWVSRGEGYCYR